MLVFDTYAIIEIIEGNKNYQPYINEEITINEFILAELSYWLIRDHGKEKALNYIEKYKQYVKKADANIIFQAMLFRYKYKKKKLSMADCISYIMSIRSNVKFLTGDKEFENFPNVEFVK